MLPPVDRMLGWVVDIAFLLSYDEAIEDGGVFKVTKFAERIKVIRKKLGLSQEEFGSLFHVSRQAVSKWESNQSIPDINTLSLICKTLNISSDELLFSESDQKRRQTEDSFSLDRQLMIKRRFVSGLILVILSFVTVFWLWLDIRVGSHFIRTFNMGLRESPVKMALLILAIIVCVIGLVVIYNTTKDSDK